VIGNGASDFCALFIELPNGFSGLKLAAAAAEGRSGTVAKPFAFKHPQSGELRTLGSAQATGGFAPILLI
jgi:hypothetical protein